MYMNRLWVFDPSTTCSRVGVLKETILEEIKTKTPLTTYNSDLMSIWNMLIDVDIMIRGLLRLILSLAA